LTTALLIYGPSPKPEDAPCHDDDDDLTWYSKLKIKLVLN
jgi:hypothetical protein